MKKPKMILFDYGQTLISESGYDPEKGTAAVMQYAVGNKHCRSAKEVQAEADAVRAELGRSDPRNRHMFNVEIPNHMFNAYLYQSVGVELSLTAPEIDRVFWDAASPGKPTDGIEDFLAFLKKMISSLSLLPASICSANPTGVYSSLLWRWQDLRRTKCGT